MYSFDPYSLAIWAIVGTALLGVLVHLPFLFWERRLAARRERELERMAAKREGRPGKRPKQ